MRYGNEFNTIDTNQDERLDWEEISNAETGWEKQFGEPLSEERFNDLKGDDAMMTYSEYKPFYDEYKKKQDELAIKEQESAQKKHDEALAKKIREEEQAKNDAKNKKADEERKAEEERKAKEENDKKE